MLKCNNIKLRLYILLAFLAGTNLQASPYEDAKIGIKSQLCSMKGRLMPDVQYLKFVESHLQKAEKELATVQYLQTKTQFNADDWDYLGRLIDCNAAMFNHHIYPQNPVFKQQYAYCSQKLKQAIADIKNKTQIQTDVDAEFARTINLLKSANKKFYSELSPVIKTMLVFAKYYDCSRRCFS